MKRGIFKHDPHFLAWAGFNFFRHLGSTFGPMAAQSTLEGVLNVPSFKVTFQPVPVKESGKDQGSAGASPYRTKVLNHD